MTRRISGRLPHDISKLLKSLPGVSAVNVKTLAATGDTPAAKQYFFYYAQAIDHTDPQKGSFNQQVGIQISSDLKNPVILHTQGYAMMMDGTFFWNDHLRNYLDANWIEVEFRYFGQSQPEAMDNVQYSYLYSYQAAADLHEIVSLLKKNLFKESKWLATGASKGGITSGLQAYFSDKNGWKDIDVYVPFCAPFLPGTSASPLDSSMGKYVLTQCGAGYAEGTAEARGYANLQKILQASVSDKNLRDALLREFHAQYPDTYATIMSQMGGATEERMLAGVLNMFMETLLGRFSYTPFGQWAAFVPEADAYDKVVNFVFMSEDDFNKLVGGEEGGETKAIHTEAEMLRKINGHSGLTAHLGTNDVREVEHRIAEGDKKAKLVLDAMIYSISRWLASLAPATNGHVDAVILTGAIAHSKYVTDGLRQRLSYLAPVFVYPGEDELTALAMNVLRAMRGEQEIKVYS